jgi:hypothetical protein
VRVNKPEGKRRDTMIEEIVLYIFDFVIYSQGARDNWTRILGGSEGFLNGAGSPILLENPALTSD